MDQLPVQKCNELEDTSDEDHEELPYDGNLNTADISLAANIGNCAFSAKTSRKSDFEADLTVQASDTNLVLNDQYTPDWSASMMANSNVNEMQSHYNREARIVVHTAKDLQDGKNNTETMEYKSHEDTVTSRTHNKGPPSGITDLLLRHLPQEELFNASKYIEAETMPEVSFIDSIEETVLTKVPHSPRHSEDGSSAIENSQLTYQDFELSYGSKCPVLDVEKLEDSKASERVSGSDQVVAHREESELHCTFSGPDLTDHSQIPRFPLGSIGSYSELKYGQGQVHYPLPDFSKVAPKVKIPKSINPVKPDSKFPSEPTLQSSLGLLNKSSKTTAVVISKPLEDSVEPPNTLQEFNNLLKHGSQSKTSELVQHLQAEYDKLLTKYAEAENLIDQMRLGTKAQASSDSPITFENVGLPEMETLENTMIQADAKQTQPLHTGHPPKDPQKLDKHTTVTDQQTSEGERMNNELKEIIGQFMEKVEEFKIQLNCMSTSISEQQMIFKSMMDAQDQLERNYIAKKEEHRALQMQNYIGVTINTGEFDPERELEGEIFRLGMLLEDIKEQIDYNICNQFSPPTSSPSLAYLLPDSTVPLCPTQLQKGHSPGLSPCRPDEVGVAGAEAGNSPLTPASGSVQQNHHSLRILAASPEKQGSSSCEEEEEPYLSEGSLSSTAVPQGKQGKPNSLTSYLKARDPLSLDLLENPPVFSDLKAQGFSRKIQSTLQSTTTPEMDSGIGGLATSHPSMELFCSDPQTEKSEGHSSPFGLTYLDSKASWSNQQAAMAKTVQSTQSERPSDSTADQWTCSISKEHVTSPTEWTDELDSHTHGQGPHLVKPHLPHPQPRSRVTAEVPSHTCSCHSDLIKALQSEVDRLKRDLEQSLLCLPYIAKRMDELTSKLRQEQRPKRKPRSHIQSVSTSYESAQHRHEALMKSGAKSLLVEDWISLDMDPTTHSSTMSKGKHFPSSKSTYHAAKPTNTPLAKNWRSSKSLPASFAEIKRLPKSHLQNVSTQSDSALQPCNPCFLKSENSFHYTVRARSHSKSKRQEQDEISRTLDHAIQAAWCMKQTTDRMALSLSADLAKADLYRKLQCLNPQASKLNTKSKIRTSSSETTA